MAEEKNFENRIKAYFHSVGVYPSGMGKEKMQAPQVGWYTKIWGGGYQKSGIPDILCCINGLFVGIEVKSTNGRPTTLQLINCSRIRAAGGAACVLYPSGFERFQKDIEFIIRHDRVLKNMKLQSQYK